MNQPVCLKVRREGEGGPLSSLHIPWKKEQELGMNSNLN